MKGISYNKGVSIIETVIAVAIMSLLILGVTGMLVSQANSQRRNRAITQVEIEAANIMDQISRSIRNASTVSSPATSTNSTSLTLTFLNNPSQNPTTYSLSSSTLMVSRGGGGRVLDYLAGRSV